MIPSPPEPSHAIAIAEWLAQAHAARERFEPFADRLGLSSLAEAYDVQRAFIAIGKRSGRAATAGHKIGLTSTAMQALCGIDTPVAGVVLDDRVHSSGHALRLQDHHRLGIEFEIAVRIGRDLVPLGRPFAFDDVVTAIDAVAPAIEIVDDRGCDYATLDVRSLVADNAWNAGIVHGPFRAGWPDLAGVTGHVSVDGTGVRHQGRGSDVLGHPLHAVAWLANHLAVSGEALQAGQIVMTGSMIATQFPDRPAHYVFDLGELGHVELSVAR